MLSPLLVIAPSRIHGRGVFARTNIPAGADLGASHYYDAVPWGSRASPWRTTDLGEYHNHSTNPNARNVRFGAVRSLVVTRPVQAGEEITVDYRLQPDLEQPRPGWSR